jgi:hypothetical protein
MLRGKKRLKRQMKMYLYFKHPLKIVALGTTRSQKVLGR